MQYGLEAAARGIVGENRSAQPAAVEPSIRCHCPGSEGRHHCAKTGLVPRRYRVSGKVGVGDFHAECRNRPRHFRFATADASRQSYDIGHC